MLSLSNNDCANDKTTYSLAVGEDANQRLDFQDSLFRDRMIQAFKTVDSFKNISGSTIVDFGCGTSSTYDGITYLIGSTGQYIGIDASKEQITFNKSRFKEALYIVGDENSAASKAAISSADIVYLRFVVMHQKNPRDFVEEIYGAMKPGAILIIQEPEDTEYRKAEMVKKYPFSGNLCDFKIKVGKKLDLDYSFSKNLEPIFKELKPKRLIHTAEHIYVPLKQAKKLLENNIKEIGKKDVDKKILTDEEIKNYICDISKLPEESDDYWNLDFLHTFIAEKGADGAIA